MDPFTQRMLEKAEQRSRALGVCNVDASAAAAPAPAPQKQHTSQIARQQQQQQQQLLQQQQQQQQSLPLHTSNSSGSVGGGSGTYNKLQVVEKSATAIDTSHSSVLSGTSTAGGRVLRQFATVDKENMDLGIEINITTDKRVEVQVQVEEQDITDDEDGSVATGGGHVIEMAEQPLAKIRDSSRNRLQRLGALYSNTADLSSPIHRTEAQFHAEDSGAGDGGSPKRPKQRYGKLVALANTINQWEDDTSHHTSGESVAPPPPKPDLPSRKVTEVPVSKKGPAPPPPQSAGAQPKTTTKATTSMAAVPEQHTTSKSCVIDAGAGGDKASKTKQLKWDPKVINSLEAQGFQRRESSTVKLSYEYNNDEDTPAGSDRSVAQQQEQPQQQAVTHKSTKPSKFPTNAETQNKHNEAAAVAEKKAPPPAVKAGLVSGRAAAFESKASGSGGQQQRPQKDPTELSLKERMQLFERNKGEALIPKAAFGMAPSINKIRQDTAVAAVRREEAKGSAAVAAANAPTVRTGAVTNIRDKVAALVAGASTISENKIKSAMTKQRQEEMELLANRFHKQKAIATISSSDHQQEEEEEDEYDGTSATPPTQAPTPTSSEKMRPPPPPPPPMSSPAPPVVAATGSVKRRSAGDDIDEENKRPKKVPTTATVRSAAAAGHRLYPALPDRDTNESCSSSTEDGDETTTTATVSSRSAALEERCAMLGGKARPVNAHGQQQQQQQQRRLQQREEQDNDSYMDSEADDSTADICNGSLGREIMQVVQQNDQQERHAKQAKEVRYSDKNHYYDAADMGNSSISSSLLSMGVDDYLDEALEDDGDDDCTQESDCEDTNTSQASGKSKGTTTSNSFSFRKTPKKHSNYHAISEEEHVEQTYAKPVSNGGGHVPVHSKLTVDREDDSVVLVHTVSFYRRQQSANSANSTPVRKVCREQQVLRSAMDNVQAAAMRFEDPQKQSTPRSMTTDEEEETVSESENDDAQLVQEKIKKLLDEMCKQQQVIGQTSQALNLCAATVEFSGSTESVEGERHLLVATHRRQSCLDEVQRLRVERTLRPQGAPKEKGRLTVKDITVQLRQDYIRKLATDTISGHHLVCLLKYNEHVLATKTVPTLPGLLAVKFPDVLQLNNVYADFRITLEIYGMTAQREVLPHEVKYHINLNKKTGVKTPKKKGSDNILVMPPVQSPAGPNAVRTPALVQYGFAIFSLREIQRTTWSLTQVLGVSPLEGVVHMKVNCELSVSVEHKGFLTMFEDISGFGAWHRRWCYLNGSIINYWKYPDDERKKAPMGSIDLYSCNTQKVTLAPRDICARLNTILLECQRPARDTDRESLIVVPNGRHTTLRHLLSADTKEEREEWCAYLNKALTLLRAWGGPMAQ